MPNAAWISRGASTLTNSSTGAWRASVPGPRSVAEAGHWLAGRLALVTGASRGIGAATAEAIAAAGARVVLAARDRAALDAVVDRIREAGGEASAVTTDVSSASDVERLFDEVHAAGPLEALVCAAAVLTPVRLTETTAEIWG